MANTVTSPNMSLPIPVTGVQPGPDYANNINSALTILDGHNHSAGSGTQITPSGLNINSDLTLGNNGLTSIKSLKFQAQDTLSTVGALYMIGVDLYYNDGSGNAIRMTQSGSVAGAAGTITGLPSGTASASYGSGVFTFQAASNTGANIDGASYVLRNNTSGSFGLTLSPPNAMGSNYSLFLPSLPAQTNVMTLDASGNMGSITYDAVGQAMTATGANAIANTRTRTTGTTVAAGGVATSASSGSFSSTASGLTLVTNLQVTITTTGRPVIIHLISASTATGLGNESYLQNTTQSTQCEIIRDGTTVGNFAIQANDLIGSLSGFMALDVITAGTYTYSFYVNPRSQTFSVRNVKLVAYEI